MGPFYALNPLRGGASKGSGVWIPHAKGAKDGKEYWLLEIRAGNRANDAGWVAGSDREGGDIFGNDGAGADDDTVTQGDTLKNYGTSPKNIECRSKIGRCLYQGLFTLTA